MSRLRSYWIVSGLALCCVLILGTPRHITAGTTATVQPPAPRMVMVPDEDRFTPFAITVRVGTTVVWANNDTDSHTVVSDDAFNTAGHNGTNVLLPSGGTFRLTFTHPGVFPYYCRFHAMLDSDNQPIAPGPFGGIQDSNGNFGTPMAGVITVISN